METKLNILKEFFENPNKEFHIRELSRILKINHTTIRQHLNKLVKQNYLTLNKSRLYSAYKLEASKKTLNLKLYYNLEKLRKSKLIKDLEKYYDYPVIVLLGSYAKAEDDPTSDIDIFVLTEIKKEFNLTKHEKFLNKEISLHKFSKESFKKLEKSNPHFINNLCNGIVLSGTMEVL